jgi:flagellum-specific peptidoglycan hydrolase FlgJ
MKLTDSELKFLNDTANAALQANHIYPAMAACEAALESGWGTSLLARQDHNLFGTKQHLHPVYGTHNLPTKEFLHNEWEVVNAAWVSYPSTTECFLDRMATLQRLAHAYPHYAAALAAPDAGVYVTEVSKSWSTDPERADKVLNFYHAYTGS